MRAFPDMISWDNWGDIMLDVNLFAPLAREALSGVGLPCGRLRAGFPGTNAVFVADEKYVVKIYAPLTGLNDSLAERSCYRLMRDADMPLTPRFFGEGALDYGGHHWEYIIIEYLPGEAVRDVWRDMPPDRRIEAGRFVGAWAKRYHALSEPFSPESELSTAAWRAGLSRRCAANLDRLQKAGCRPSFLDGLSRTAMDRLFTPRDIVLTHCDLTEDHLLIAEDGRMRLIDFADSRMAFSCLEWMPLWFGMLARDTDAFSAYLAETGETYSREDMLLSAMLHGYGAPILLSCVPGLADMPDVSLLPLP